MKRLVFAAACLAMAAFAAPTKVVVYTAHEDSILNALAPRFEKDTGIKLEYVKLASGDVIKRAKAEAANPQADVIWSIGGEQLEAENAILAPYTPKEWAKIAPVFKVGTNWLPYTGIMNVFVVNTKMVAPDKMPRKWTDLADARFKKLISSARADKSGSSYMQLCNTLLVYKDKGWDVYKGIMENMVVSASSGRRAEVRERRRAGRRHHARRQRLPLRAGRWSGQDRLPRGRDRGGSRRHRPAQGRSQCRGRARPSSTGASPSPSRNSSSRPRSRRSVRTDCKDPVGLPALKTIKTVPYDFGWAAKNKTDFSKKFADMAMDLGL